MIIDMKRKLDFIFLWILVLPISMMGFTFTANATDESCAGNGTITFTTLNPDPNGSILFVVYKLPDTTTPYATVSANTINGLSSGTYNIIAQETVNGVTTTQQQQVVINNTIVPLVYSVTALNQACATTSTISVDIISGVGATYEIIDGPMLFPSQTSNQFSGLVPGIYRVRVFDNCGIGVVQTFTVTLNTAGLTISQPTVTSTSPPSCNFIVVTNTLTPASGTVIGYPLDITYQVNPPNGGTPIITTSTLNSGNATSQNLVLTIPDYINETYDYSISITDACGATYTENFPLDNSIQISSNITILECNQNFFSLNISNFTPPFNLNFTSVPAGFDPALYNTGYPGPFSTNIVVFGSETNITPLGSYTVDIVDSCGRTGTRVFTIDFNQPEPNVFASSNGCLSNTGNFTISITNFDIVTAVITSAPAGYPNSLPHNVSGFIDSEGDLIINPVPFGDYIVDLIDECGTVLPPVSLTVSAYVNQGNSVIFRPGCGLGFTSLELSSNNGGLTSVIISSAPSSYTTALPNNVTSNILANGRLYLDNLPQGTYIFDTVDACGFTNSYTVDAQGYSISDNTSSLQINCGSFNVPLSFVSNGVMAQTFWLQKLIDPATNTWGHPGTNVVYPNGTVPDATNSYPLINFTSNFNLSFNGTFRIFRHFLSYNNGASVLSGSNPSIDKNCFEVINPSLDFDQALEILSTNRLFCSSSGTLDVVLSATGEAPLNYSITTQNGTPFFLDNGTSNIFYNLPTGVYTFQVEDVCGNIVTKIYDVAALSSFINANQPDDLLQCATVITGNETFNLGVQTPIILGTLPPADYSISYHASLNDAQNDLNEITSLTNFNPTSNPQTIYVRMIFNAVPDCYDVKSFDVIVGQTPVITTSANTLGCSSSPVTLDASAGNLPTTTYLWSTGATTPTITVSQLGVTNLTVTATNSYGVDFCSNTKDITVTISEQPEIDQLVTVDWTEDDNSITVITTNTGAFEYSLDDVIYQDSNVFSNLAPGFYTVYVQDKFGCGKTQQVIWILYYIRFFTPNGDGINETWRIKNSQFEQDLTVIIFDRYGKVITSFGSDDQGWDGLYNGQQAISDDYWFLVSRQDGRTHRGHFALKR